MQPGQTISIRKSLVGLVIIYLVGFGIAAMLALCGYWQRLAGQTDLSLLLFACAGASVLFTMLQAIVYNMSRIILSDLQLDIANWNSIVSNDTAQCDWSQVQDVDIKKSGLLPMVFDYGTLRINTASGDGVFRITYIPKVEYWRDVIAARAAK